MLDIISHSLVERNSKSACHEASGLLFNYWMTTAGEVRRNNLRKIVTYFGTMAELNRRLGRDVRDATLGQILIGSPNSKTQKPRQMGDRLARSIEEAFGWDRGRMDAPLQEPLFAAVQEQSVRYDTRKEEKTVTVELGVAELDFILKLRQLQQHGVITAPPATPSSAPVEKLRAAVLEASQKNPPPVPAPPNVRSLKTERRKRLGRGSSAPMLDSQGRKKK